MYKRQVLPDISANVSYQTYGVGGDLLSPITSLTGTQAPRTIVGQQRFGSVLGDVLTSQYPTWTFGVTMSYPLGGNTQETNLARAKLQYDQAKSQLQNLEMQIGTQVRDAARQVQTNAKRVDSARAARDLAEQRLAAEEKKFAAGMSTNFLVTQAQRDLAVAEVGELRSIADYRQSIIELDRVEEAGAGISSGFVAAR